MEVELRAPPEHGVSAWIEPWGDRIEVPPGRCVRLALDGDAVESLVVEWLNQAVRVGVPRHVTLRVLDESGDVLGEYDSDTLPDVPEGVRPI